MVATTEKKNPGRHPDDNGENAVRTLPPNQWGPGWNPPKGFIRDPESNVR